MLWVDRLTPEEFRNGFGSHTPMFSGQTKCVRYYMNCTRALKLFSKIIQKQGYVVNADNKQIQLSDKQLKAVADVRPCLCIQSCLIRASACSLLSFCRRPSESPVDHGVAMLAQTSELVACAERAICAVQAKMPAPMFAALGVDCWVVVPIGSTSRREAGHTLEGTRLTLTRSRDQADAYEFSIRTPVTPARWEDFDKELAAGFEDICTAAVAEGAPATRSLCVA